MRRQFWHGDGARHREAALQERPIERFSIEGDEDGAFGETPRKFMKKGMFFSEITHKELLDLQAASIPPRQAHEKRVGSRATCKPGRFSVQKEPFSRIC